MAVEGKMVCGAEAVEAGGNGEEVGVDLMAELEGKEMVGGKG